MRNRILTLFCLLGGALTVIASVASEAWASPAIEAMILELESPPLAVLNNAKVLRPGNREEAQKRLMEIEASQQSILRILAAKHAETTVIYRTQRVYNGIAVRAPAESLAALKALPGVRSVHAIRRVRWSTSTSIPFLQTPLVWDGNGLGLTGRNITIGVIDTGIDYLHPNFGQSGDPADYQSNNPRILNDVPFPTPKIAGGYDFVGEKYDPSDRDNDVPDPDPDPFDTQGHGTHVAGIAGGVGVENNAPYSGIYSPLTPFQRMQLGPGAAPESILYALKIFGAGRESDIILPAIEWAVDPNGDGDFSDHLDIINLSFGDPFGATDSPESVACDHAAEAGVLVVASAGNSGDSYFSLGSPGASPWAISVAASEDSDLSVAGLSPDRLAYFSSRGPAISHAGDLFLKPDIAAPGNMILSSAAYAENNGALSAVKSGTSMAAPHISGMMSLLREQHPDWTVAELKALVMNTAMADVYSQANYGEPRHSPQRAGVGRVDIFRAARNETLLFNAGHPEQVNVTFHTQEVLDTVEETQTVRVFNKSGSAHSYLIALEPRTEIPGVTITVSTGQTASVPPGGTFDLVLKLKADASAIQHSRDPAATTLYEGVARSWLSEVSGNVVCVPVGTNNAIRISYYGALRPISDVYAGASSIDVQSGAHQSITVTGKGLRTGNDYPRDTVSLASVFELLYASPDEPATQGLEDAADIRFVGISSDYTKRLAQGQGIDETTVYIAVSAHGKWASPNWAKFLIYIDADNDGRTDFGLYNGYSLSNIVQEGSRPDVFSSILTDFVEEQSVEGFVNFFSPAIRDTAPFLTDIMVLPVRAADLGLSEENSVIAFHVESTVLLHPREVLDQAPPQRPAEPTRVFTYDVTRPGIRFTTAGEAPLFEVQDNTVLSLDYDAEAYTFDTAMGALILYHHNPMGKRAQWMPVITAGDTDNDGISDAAEGISDPDNDTLPNLVDSDADGDGIDDMIEGTGDADLDTIPNYLDLDCDNDAIPDLTEGSSDADSDGTANYLDSDSDGDGIDDRIEGSIDSDDDLIPNFLDTDADGDGIPDQVEGVVDPDEDTIPNYLDLDSDGDGIPDEAEGADDPDLDKLPNFVDPDSDGDDLLDQVEGMSDADLDGLPNFVDPDSDGDDLLDQVEGVGDPDVDGLPNYVDPDSDNDELLDSSEGSGDTDHDGYANFVDTDSDDDTLSDHAESVQYFTNPYDSDTDHDGLLDPDELKNGTDPTHAQAPSAPVHVQASKGTLRDQVSVRWDSLPGYVEYRVWRGSSSDLVPAAPLSETWQSATTFQDLTALPPEKIPGRGCHGATYENVVYWYWVQARMVPIGGSPTLPGPFSAPESGYRARE